LALPLQRVERYAPSNTNGWIPPTNQKNTPNAETNQQPGNLNCPGFAGGRLG
jgi:hypothetical protein